MFTLKGYSVPNRLHKKTIPGTCMTKWSLRAVCCLDNEKQNPARKKPRGKLRQSEVFFPLAIVAHVVPPFVLPYPRIIQIFDRAIVISDNV